MAATQTGSTALTVVGWCSLAVAFACALAIARDIFVAGNRQRMRIMEAVWPITALYWGPVAAWFYFRRARRERDEEAPEWWAVSKGVSHCGAGCTLGDILGEWLVYAFGWTVGSFATHKYNVLLASFIVDFGFAWTLGIVFQYFSIVPKREDIGRLEGI